jgi:hypothetical protein
MNTYYNMHKGKLNVKVIYVPNSLLHPPGKLVLLHISTLRGNNFVYCVTTF